MEPKLKRLKLLTIYLQLFNCYDEEYLMYK